MYIYAIKDGMTGLYLSKRGQLNFIPMGPNIRLYTNISPAKGTVTYYSGRKDRILKNWDRLVEISKSPYGIPFPTKQDILLVNISVCLAKFEITEVEE